MGQQGVRHASKSTGTEPGGGSTLRWGLRAADPEYVAAFEREMQRRREQRAREEQQNQTSGVVSAVGRLLVAVAVALPALSYTAALHTVAHGLPPLILPDGMQLKILTESEAAEASPEIKKAGGFVQFNR